MKNLNTDQIIQSIVNDPIAVKDKVIAMCLDIANFTIKRAEDYLPEFEKEYPDNKKLTIKKDKREKNKLRDDWHTIPRSCITVSKNILPLYSTVNSSAAFDSYSEAYDLGWKLKHKAEEFEYKVKHGKDSPAVSACLLAQICAHNTKFAIDAIKKLEGGNIDIEEELQDLIKYSLTDEYNYFGAEDEQKIKEIIFKYFNS